MCSHLSSRKTKAIECLNENANCTARHNLLQPGRVVIYLKLRQTYLCEESNLLSCALDDAVLLRLKARLLESNRNVHSSAADSCSSFMQLWWFTWPCIPQAPTKMNYRRMKSTVFEMTILIVYILYFNRMYKTSICFATNYRRDM